MASTATITKSKDGPGITVSGLTIPNVTRLDMQLGSGTTLVRNALEIYTSDRSFPYQFDINATTTYTVTITAGGNVTLTVNEP
jgi:hypothetical protein